MKSSITNLFVAKFAVAVTLLVAVPVSAQDGSGLVVVLDVAKVFKVNQHFDSSLKAIQAEAEELKTKIQKDQQNLKSQADQVTQQFKPGTPEFQREETRLEQELAALRTTARQLESGLLKKEAQLYHDTYLKMQQVVGQIAEKHNIDLVLRFDSSQINPANRADVIKGVNRGVVFQKNLDITDMVIEQMGPRIADQSVIQGQNN